jgi:hypothetical protein
MPLAPSAPSASAAGDLAPLAFAPHLLEWVRRWSSDADIRCGGQPPPPDPPFAASLYPFTTLTRLDYEGYPNWRDKRLESNLSLGPQGWYIGYEDGEFVAAGKFTPGRVLRWDLRLDVLCATHADTFIELVVEPNPKVGVHGGPNRMRCLTGALGQTWSGHRAAQAFVEVEAVTRNSFVARGQLAIAAMGTRPPLTRTFTVPLVSTSFDANRMDALWQLRWRIDRIAHLDLYDGTHQVAGPDGEPLERGLVLRGAGFGGS